MDKVAFLRCSLLTREKEESVLQVAAVSTHVSAKVFLSLCCNFKFVDDEFCVSGHRAVVYLLSFRHRNTCLMATNEAWRCSDM